MFFGHRIISESVASEEKPKVFAIVDP